MIGSLGQCRELLDWLFSGALNQQQCRFIRLNNTQSVCSITHRIAIPNGRNTENVKEAHNSLFKFFRWPFVSVFEVSSQTFTIGVKVLIYDTQD